MSQLPVADYALLSDCRSAALVSRAGSVDWLCFPRFDGPSVFARLLDDAGGHWSILVPGADGTRRYVDQTMVLETTFEARSGTAVLTDAMAVGRNDLGHDLGAGSPRRAAAPGGLPGRPGGGHGRVRTATRVRAGPPAAPGGRGWPGRPRRRRRSRPVRTGRPTGGGRHREGPAGAPRGGGGLLRAAPRARLGAAAVDVYGELLGAAQRLVDQLGELDATTSGFLVAAADAAADRWMERDQGIWEIRGEPRHFLYSKLMCWWALDRAIALADRLGAGDRVVRWTAVRDEIRAAILEHGWSDRAGAYTQAFGSDELDASALMMAATGFLPGTDPRMKATVDAIAEHLTDERGLVYRYRTADGLKGEEGTFLLCTFWLAHAHALAGELDRARATFERAAAYRNDVGLLAEEVDANGELIGNFPQAFSHIGLINAAWAITEAEAGARGSATAGRGRH